MTLALYMDEHIRRVITNGLKLRGYDTITYAVFNSLIPNKLMNLDDLLKSYRQEILRIAAEYGAYNIRIFGSVARNEADSNSDVDFLVELEPGRSLFDLGGLLMDLQNLLGCPVDVVTEKGLKKRIREQVLKEAISL